MPAFPSLTSADVPTRCPECHSALVTGHDGEPWCERCEWNLDAAPVSNAPSRVDRRLRRLDHKAGYDLSATLFRTLVGKKAQPPTVSLSEIALVGITALILALLIGMTAVGLHLVITASLLGKALGLLLVAVAVVLRPRLGAARKVLGDADPLTEAQAPALFAVVREVAAKVGAPMPHTIATTSRWEASTLVVGLRRRRILLLGLPFWSVLRPQERVAVLAHELGHFVNGDGSRRLALQPAVTVFGTIADLIDPRQVLAEVRDRVNGTVRPSAALLAGLVLLPVVNAVRGALLLLHMGTHALAARSSQRAEYYADDLAAQAGGSTAVVGLLDVLVLTSRLKTRIGTRARQKAGVIGWRETVEDTRAEYATAAGQLRQLSIREDASIFAAHPQPGLRVRMIQAAPHREPTVVLTEARAAAVDAELAKYEERYRREIAEHW
ncbi:M48 family metalloprotease [Hamadaea sp. NPDC051192]|uniref:M48 family metallopeptidase n=1 Tax=Hamadaea sp. NPDC051192 TaxID=3154940 RepID=UPI0034244FBD